jgi:hypothetical protein
MDEIRRSFARAGLYRSRDDRVLGGVCTGSAAGSASTPGRPA